MTRESAAGRDGTFALRDGKIQIMPPEGEGRLPTISPGKGVELWVDGQQVQQPVLLTPEQKVQVIPQNRPGKREIKVEVSPDKLEATVKVFYDPGENFSLPEIPPTTQGVVEGVGEPALPPVTVEDVGAELVAKGIFVGIMKEAVEEAVQRADGQPVVVARGTPPGESQDAWVEYLFSQEEKVVRPTGEEKVDYRERFEIPTAAAGELLAVKHPPKMGSPGMAVTGETIQPRVPRDVAIKVGKGAEVSANGLEARAAIGGRPVVEGRGLIKVLPVLVQRGDVDLSTGNITFNGDVEIYGKVTENMKVRSEGTITVYQTASHALLQAERDVNIHASLIGGTVRAGGLAALYRQLEPVLEDLAGELIGMEQALDQLLQFPKAKAQVEKKGYGPLFQLLLDQKYKQIPQLTVKLYEQIKGKSELPEEDQQVSARLQEAFQGINVQRLTPEDLQTLYRLVRNWHQRVREQGSHEASVTLKYAQNAHIEATGKVIIEGQGSYHSEIMAGTGVNVFGSPGVVRGGVVQSFGDVFIKEAGSPGGTVTIISCSGEASLELEKVHPNVIIQVGNIRHKFSNNAMGVRARLVQGELKIK